MSANVTFGPQPIAYGYLHVMWAQSPTAHDDWKAAWHAARIGEWVQMFNSPRFFNLAKRLLSER